MNLIMPLTGLLIVAVIAVITFLLWYIAGGNRYSGKKASVIAVININPNGDSNAKFVFNNAAITTSLIKLVSLYAVKVKWVLQNTNTHTQEIYKNSFCDFVRSVQGEDHKSMIERSNDILINLKDLQKKTQESFKPFANNPKRLKIKLFENKNSDFVVKKVFRNEDSLDTTISFFVLLNSTVSRLNQDNLVELNKILEKLSEEMFKDSNISITQLNDLVR